MRSGRRRRATPPRRDGNARRVTAPSGRIRMESVLLDTSLGSGLPCPMPPAPGRPSSLAGLHPVPRQRSPHYPPRPPFSSPCGRNPIYGREKRDPRPFTLCIPPTPPPTFSGASTAPSPPDPARRPPKTAHALPSRRTWNTRPAGRPLLRRPAAPNCSWPAPDRRAMFGCAWPRPRSAKVRVAMEPACS